jgi:hypothetical protein
MGRPKKQISFDRIKEALEKWNGQITTAAAELKINYRTLKSRVDSDPQLQEIIENETDKVAITAKKNIADAINEGNIQLSCWWLKNHVSGKRQGFGDRKDLSQLLSGLSEESEDAPELHIHFPKNSGSNNS